MTADLASLPWRTGRTLGRTLYARTGGDDYKADTCIGVLDTPELAEAACAAHNADLIRRKTEESSPDGNGGCPCGHGPDDICLNGRIYGNCGLPNCEGGCDPDAGECRSLPGCCDPEDAARRGR
jgi:hypothetical protein